MFIFGQSVVLVHSEAGVLARLGFSIEEHRLEGVQGELVQGLVDALGTDLGVGVIVT